VAEWRPVEGDRAAECREVVEYRAPRAGVQQEAMQQHEGRLAIAAVTHAELQAVGAGKRDGDEARVRRQWHVRDHGCARCLVDMVGRHAPFQSEMANSAHIMNTQSVAAT
jgi:hypothetical protein